jgi:chromate transporter
MDNSRKVKSEHQARSESSASLWQLAILFLRLGTTAFGGPAAHIAMMEDEVVRRRQWLTREQFLDMLGATNLIPGPNSTELAIHIGHQQRGWPGLLVAGSCFILPATLIVAVFAWVYVHFGSLPQVRWVLYGVKPIIIAVVLQALWSLGRSAAKTKSLAVLGLIAVVLSFAGVNELLIIFASGAIVAAGRWFINWRKRSPAASLGISATGTIAAFIQAAASPLAGGASTIGLWPLFLFFLKVGSVLFGSGYVLLAFLRGDLVERWHWLTNAQLLDAIAVGQVTPGPVFTTATFIGYLLAGPSGAIVATVGIFLPAFVFVAISGPLLPRIRRSPTAGAFLDGVNVGSLALMLVVTWELGRTALIDITTVALAIVSAGLLIYFRVNSVWLVFGGAAVGLVVYFGNF